MTKVKTIEFWLFALPALFVLVGLLVGFDRILFARTFVINISVAWMILAIAWMFRELWRRIRN
jgi:hypothetical protein